VAGGDSIDESEVDGSGDHLEAADSGAHDHLALEVEAVGPQPHVAQQVRRVEAKTALRIGDAGLRRLGDRPGRESIGEPAAGQHLTEEMRASADDQVGLRLLVAL
jgi:hypothetical protein